MPSFQEVCNLDSNVQFHCELCDIYSKRVPLFMLECGKRLCGTCLQRLEQTPGQICPFCNSTAETNWSLRNHVESEFKERGPLNCRCDFSFDQTGFPARGENDRCPDIFDVSLREAHRRECPYRWMKCNDCRACYLSRDRNNHECPYALDIEHSTHLQTLLGLLDGIKPDWHENGDENQRQEAMNAFATNIQDKLLGEGIFECSCPNDCKVSEMVVCMECIDNGDPSPFFHAPHVRSCFAYHHENEKGLTPTQVSTHRESHITFAEWCFKLFTERDEIERFSRKMRLAEIEHERSLAKIAALQSPGSASAAIYGLANSADDIFVAFNKGKFHWGPAALKFNVGVSVGLVVLEMGPVVRDYMRGNILFGDVVHKFSQASVGAGGAVAGSLAGAKAGAMLTAVNPVLGVIGAVFGALVGGIVGNYCGRKAGKRIGNGAVRLFNLQKVADEKSAMVLKAMVLLGVGVHCTARDVRSAFKQRVRATHPDHGGSHEEMLKLNFAKSVLLAYVKERDANVLERIKAQVEEKWNKFFNPDHGLAWNPVDSAI